ncbi:alpha/beta hydrolase [Nakamurella sp. A5-74]|uniref:Alpha/beta hydrolase n=1 Tax=Nakamurella sp. A5-74 TaxID=3158264 RepID=A0AAU8DKI1_9ACTN
MTPDQMRSSAGRDIVLLGGLWLDVTAWDEVAAALRGLGDRPVPVTLPGQGDGVTGATLQDQLDSVLQAVDAAQRPLVVGHSAACTLAWMAADRRPDDVSGVALIGGFPSADGEKYAEFFAITDGAMAFPGWEPFAGPDSADLSTELRAKMADSAIPVPEGVASGVVTLTDERRSAVPVTLICPEFGPAEAKEWIAAGDVPELAAARDVRFVDIDSGHWPMFTKPVELAAMLHELAHPSS